MNLVFATQRLDRLDGIALGRLRELSNGGHAPLSLSWLITRRGIFKPLVILALAQAAEWCSVAGWATAAPGVHRKGTVLISVFVDRRLRGQGIGTALVRRVVLAAHRRWPTLKPIVSVSSKMQGAIRVFKRGFAAARKDAR